MFQSVHSLLHQIIDYAGLFPPANLSLEAALKNYLHDKAASPHAWMLGRFVCPTIKLPQLAGLIQTHSSANLMQVTALGQPAGHADEVIAKINADVEAIASFRADVGRADVVDMYGVAFPKAAQIEAFPQWAEVGAKLQNAKIRGFIETTDDAQLTALMKQRDLGAKLRCGGVTADAFPSDLRVATFIAHCRDSGIAWKATAGLHHPRRQWDANLQLWHHGFLNVFIAGMIAQTHRIGSEDIAQILADREGRHFHFEDTSLGWKHWLCTAEQIAELRESAVTTFGSCSFQEPVDDLIAMKLIPG